MLYHQDDVEQLIAQFKFTDGVVLDSKTYVARHPDANQMHLWWQPCITQLDVSFAKLDLPTDDEPVYTKASAILWQQLSQHIDISAGLKLKVSVNNCKFWMNMLIAPQADFVSAFHLYQQHAELIAIDEQHQLLIGVLTEDPSEHQEQLWLYLLRYHLNEQGQPQFESL